MDTGLTGQRRLPGKRRNMNLKASVFDQIEGLKRSEEKRIGAELSWNSFFSMLVAEVQRSRKARSVK